MAVVGSDTNNNANILWDNIMTRSTISNASSPSENPRINVTDPATWSSWSMAARNNLDFDYGSVVEVDCISIAAHNLGSSGADFVLESSDDGVTGWTAAHARQFPLTDEDIIVMFPVRSSRYWRINVGPTFSIGIIFVGKRLIFPHAPIDGYTPLHHARRYTKMFNDSIKGQFLSNRVMSAGAETQVDMGFFERTWLEANIRMFERHYNQGGTFFYAGCPAKYPLDMGYCRALGEDEILAIEWTEADKMATLSFGVRAYVG